GVGGTGLLAYHGVVGEPAPAKKDAATKPPFPAPSDQGKEIDRLIRQLGSRQFAEREAASKRLEAIGEPTLDALHKAAEDSTDAEVRKRSQAVLRAIQQRLFGEVRRFKGHTNWVIGVAISPDGRRALSGGFDATLRLWDLEAGKELHRFKGHTDQVLSVAFSPDGRQAL